MKQICFAAMEAIKKVIKMEWMGIPEESTQESVEE